MTNCWTPTLVEERLVEAASVMKRLPNVRGPGCVSAWPKMLLEFADLVEQEPSPLKAARPSPDAITRMEETLNWLRWLQPDDSKLVWSRAERTPWKPICWRFGISRATAHRRWQYGLSVIALRLNGRSVPAKRSRSFVVEGARRL